jgi:hypothetical protein
VFAELALDGLGCHGAYDKIKRAALGRGVVPGRLQPVLFLDFIINDAVLDRNLPVVLPVVPSHSAPASMRTGFSPFSARQ